VPLTPLHCARLQAVSQLLEVLGAAGDTPVPVPSWHYEEPAERSRRLAGGADMQLQDALAACYDLRQPREAQLLAALWDALPPAARASASAPSSDADASDAGSSGSGSDEPAAAAAQLPVSDSVASLDASGPPGGGKAAAAQAAALAALRQAEPDAQAQYWAARHVVDVLRDFPAARLSAAQLLPALRQLQPRLYSISSAPLEQEARVQVGRSAAAGAGALAGAGPGRRAPATHVRQPWGASLSMIYA
jgi:sulfite reductase (NADPH) flavoprotein alpha-component